MKTKKSTPQERLDKVLETEFNPVKENTKEFAQERLDLYIGNQKKKGVEVKVVKPIYTAGHHRWYRCILSLNGETTKMYYNPPNWKKTT